jgi:hypothetical protein
MALFGVDGIEPVSRIGGVDVRTGFGKSVE